MQLWVSKLNKNKWKITLIILSVALITSCIFGVTTAWFNTVDRAKAKVSMDVNYVDIFAGSGESEHQLIPSKYYKVDNAPKVLIGEDSGIYCVFLKIQERGGCFAKDVEYFQHINYTLNQDWHSLPLAQIKEYGFSTGGENDWTAYYYQVINASEAGGQLTIFEPIAEAPNSESFRANPDLTLTQVEAAIDTPVTLSVVAAGCKTTAPAGGTTLPTVEEVAFAEVYTAFF